MLGTLSLPLWERGLKSSLRESVDNAVSSLPLWERGLKFGRAFLVVKIANVAPSMGAWIEIDGSMGLTKEEMVAPSM